MIIARAGHDTEFALLFFKAEGKSINKHYSKFVSRQSFCGGRSRVIVVTGAGWDKDTRLSESFFISVDRPSF